MAKLPPTKAKRDANLDTLKSAVKEWGAKEKTRLENEVKFMRAVLKGRTGSEKAGTKNLDTLQEILKLEVEDFIATGSDENRS
jgi:hypothetical protein